MQYSAYQYLYINGSSSTTSSTTTPIPTIFHPVLKDDIKFVIIPLIVIAVVMILSALVYLMAKKKQSDFVRENLLHLYEFDSNENEWETPLLNSDNNHNVSYDFGSTNV